MCEPLQIPTIGFLYIAGWIGYVGRDYLIASKAESKPTQKEIIIDVPMALKMAAQVTHSCSLLNSQSCKGTLQCIVCQCCYQKVASSGRCACNTRLLLCTQRPEYIQCEDSRRSSRNLAQCCNMQQCSHLLLDCSTQQCT